MPATKHISLEDKVQQLSQLLDELYGEIELESKHDVSIKLYFDSLDVRAMILGMEDYFNGFKFVLDHFDSNETLVQGLTVGGWLGTIYILPPHQAELLVALQSRRLSGKVDISADEFLFEVSLREGIRPLSSLKSEDFYVHVTTHVGSSRRAFNAIQCVRDANWMRRLARLRREQVLAFSAELQMNPEVVRSTEFRKLKKIFDEIRPALTLNNFADAAVVTLLIFATERFNQGESKTLPLFFTSSSDLFEKVIDRANFAERLRYKYEEYSGDVLKQPNYFILRSTFHPPESKSSRSSSKGGTRSQSAKKRSAMQNGLLELLRESLKSS